MSDLVREADLVLLLSQIRGEWERMGNRLDEADELIECARRQRMVSAVRALQKLRERT